MGTSHGSPTSQAPVASDGLPSSPQRLHVLDILRGFAILGMFIVHFNDHAAGGGASGAAVQKAVVWLIEEKAFTTFAILFGVSFAIQLYNADKRGEDVRLRFLRRLLGVLCFGVLVRAISVGAITLVGYAFSGAWLLIVRRWSNRALVVAFFVSLAFNGLWNLGVGGYQVATLGLEGANAEYKSPSKGLPAWLAGRQELRAAREGKSFLALARAREIDLYRTYSGLWGDWPRGGMGSLLTSLSGYAFMFFLLGLLAVRLKLFEHPADHRRLLFTLMGVGAVFWAIDQFQIYEAFTPPDSAIFLLRLQRPVHHWFFLFGNPPGWGLALTYIAIITLVVAASATWERRLNAVFGQAGRMALSNYVLQFPLLAVLFDNYAFGLKSISPLTALLTAVSLFAGLVVFSRWWLRRFRLGPAEWVLRSLTYGHLQPLRLVHSAEVQ